MAMFVLFNCYGSLLQAESQSLVTEKATVSAEEQLAMKKVSYALGQDLAQGLARRARYLKSIDLQLDRKEMIEGFTQAINNQLSNQKDENLFDDETLKTIIFDFERNIKVAESQLAQRETKAQKLANSAFIKTFSKNDKVQSLENNIFALVSESTKGKRPKYSDQVELKYKVKLIDGHIIQDHSRAPITVTINKALAGWQQVIPLMKVGEVWEFILPPEMAYGSSRHGSIPANSALVCQVELVSIVE